MDRGKRDQLPFCAAASCYLPYDVTFRWWLWEVGVEGQKSSGGNGVEWSKGNMVVMASSFLGGKTVLIIMKRFLAGRRRVGEKGDFFFSSSSSSTSKFACWCGMLHNGLSSTLFSEINEMIHTA